MKVKVFLMLDIDEEENILPVDEDTEEAVQEVNHLDIETGDILLFPSWLDHGVKANMTDKHRVNISFNFGVPELVNALG